MCNGGMTSSQHSRGWRSKNPSSCSCASRTCPANKILVVRQPQFQGLVFNRLLETLVAGEEAADLCLIKHANPVLLDGRTGLLYDAVCAFNEELEHRLSRRLMR